MAVQSALQLDLMGTSHDDENKSQELENSIYRTQPRKDKALEEEGKSIWMKNNWRSYETWDQLGFQSQKRQLGSQGQILY